MKKIFDQPHFIEFPKLGESSIGFISFCQNDKIPFEIKRSFWTYYTPESIVRGRHAHFQTEQILIAVTGRVVVTTESVQGEIKTFVLDKPNTGVYIPPNFWHTMQYSHTAIQLVFASTLYDENDYIRNYDEFKKIWSESK